MACGSGLSSTVGLLGLAPVERACRSHADALNAFASPLTTREAHQVAKSVAKWTWTNITPTAFSKYRQKEEARTERIKNRCDGFHR
jgi:hypothetical protein